MHRPTASGSWQGYRAAPSILCAPIPRLLLAAHTNMACWNSIGISPFCLHIFPDWGPTCTQCTTRCHRTVCTKTTAHRLCGVATVSELGRSDPSPGSPTPAAVVDEGRNERRSAPHTPLSPADCSGWAPQGWMGGQTCSYRRGKLRRKLVVISALFPAAGSPSALPPAMNTSPCCLRAPSQVKHPALVPSWTPRWLPHVGSVLI